MLSTYNNYETEPIKIGKYVIIEMYKDNIAENNKIGYHILSPNAIPKNQTTSDYITSLAQSKKPAGYENLKILYDRAGSSDTDFNNKIIYIVWYKNIEPTYPPIPQDITPIAPALPLNIWQEFSIVNNGLTTFCELIFTVSNLSVLEFYLNKQYFKFYLNINDSNTHIIKINNKGIFKDDELINNNIIPNLFLIANTNILKIKRIGISNVKINYNQTY